MLLPYLESIFVKVEINSKTFILGTVYRPPQSDFRSYLNKLDKILKHVRNNFNNANFILHGYFNLDLLNVAHNNNCNDFYSTIATHGLYPSILRPTRVPSRTDSLLGNIFMNNIDVLEKAGVMLSDTRISDHFLLFCSLHLEDNNSGESSRYV